MSLRQEHTFTNPFAMRTGSTAHVAPALLVLRSLILRFAGANSGGRLALRSLPAFALSLQLGLLPWLARRLGYSIKTGMLAWLLGLLLKPDLEEPWECIWLGLRAIAQYGRLLLALELPSAKCVRRGGVISACRRPPCRTLCAEARSPLRLGGSDWRKRWFGDPFKSGVRRVYLAWVLYAGRHPS